MRDPKILSLNLNKIGELKNKKHFYVEDDGSEFHATPRSKQIYLNQRGRIYELE